MQVSSQEPVVARQELVRAAEIIRGGGVVAFPTATTYGLAVDPFSDKALRRLFEVKQRPAAKAVPVLIGAQQQLGLLAREVPPLYLPLMAAFWPGPLTLLFRCVPNLPVLLTAGLETVGIRMDPHPVARQLLTQLGMPITATSANISGQPAAVCAHEVVRQFGATIDLVLTDDRGLAGGWSTVVGVEDDRLKLVRPGIIPFVRLEEKISAAGVA